MPTSTHKSDKEAAADSPANSSEHPALPEQDTGPPSTKSTKTGRPSKPRPSRNMQPKQYQGRTFRDIVLYHPRTEPERQGIPGFTIRELCSTLHVAAESLRSAYDEPGRLTMNGVAALAEKMNEDPLRVAADIFAEIRHKQQVPEKPKAVKRARVSKKKPTTKATKSDKANTSQPAPEATTPE